MKEIYQIAIDGPGGAGKSTIAKEVAKVLNIDYIDTGAMYRAIAYKVYRDRINPEDMPAIEEILVETQVDFSQGKTLLDGVDVSKEIRAPEIAKMASVCSKIPQVREKLGHLQREMGIRKSVVMDGRDIGTNVFKDARYKFYLTADEEVRAKRRYEELKLKDPTVDYKKILIDIKERDYSDINRTINPLKKAEDAIEIDSSYMTIDDVVNFICGEIKNNGCTKTF